MKLNLQQLIQHYDYYCEIVSMSYSYDDKTKIFVLKYEFANLFRNAIFKPTKIKLPVKPDETDIFLYKLTENLDPLLIENYKKDFWHNVATIRNFFKVIGREYNDPVAKEVNKIWLASC